MKHLFSTLLLVAAIFSLNAQTNTETNNLGVTFEISNNPNWGYGEPVVLSVENDSPAQKAGIKSGDIIMEINGEATYLKNYQTIASWLYGSKDSYVKFTVRNLNSYFKEYELPSAPRPMNSISESDIASSFSFYSLEDVQDRAFVLPLKVTPNRKIDYSDYHTFNFVVDPNAPRVDSYINSQIEKALTERGLKRVTTEPDILIQTFYNYQANPKYSYARRNGKNTTWRYDVFEEQMISLPILSGDDRDADLNGESILEFGIRFLEQKYVNPKAPTQIWEGVVKEYITGDLSLEEYVRLHTPLILMQYPYSVDKTTCRYVAKFKRYNYTGMFFDMRDMRTVVSVDSESPASLAGIRAGYVLDKIGNVKMNNSKDELMAGYKRFIIETMKYRNQATRFTDANGYRDCMYWQKKSYDDVRNAITKSIYAAQFSYLFSFEKYISTDGGRSLQVESRGSSYRVVPEIRSSVSLRAM